jgi:site-specific recombinase XerC
MPRSRAVPRRWGAEFTGDVLEVTGGGRARDFATSRDHALIWILRSEGIRRAELLGMVMHSLPADVIKAPLIRLVPSRARGPRERDGSSPWSRPAPALAVYLRARRHHRLADCDWVWLGTRGKGRLQETGLRKLLVRRAKQTVSRA